jgi:hypothetical protein
MTSGTATLSIEGAGGAPSRARAIVEALASAWPTLQPLADLAAARWRLEPMPTSRR